MEITYEDFYKIAVYGNEIWKGSFTPKEIACNAYDYKIEYETSKAKGKPTSVMDDLCHLICEDMDYMDYADTENILDIPTMERVLHDFLMEI